MMMLMLPMTMKQQWGNSPDKIHWLNVNVYHGMCENGKSDEKPYSKQPQTGNFRFFLQFFICLHLPPSTTLNLLNLQKLNEIFSVCHAFRLGTRRGGDVASEGCCKWGMWMANNDDIIIHIRIILINRTPSQQDNNTHAFNELHSFIHQFSLV